MNVNEPKALTQQFADAFDQRDRKTFLAILKRNAASMFFKKTGGLYFICANSCRPVRH